MEMKLFVDDLEVILGAKAQSNMLDWFPDTPAYKDLFAAMAKSKDPVIRNNVAYKDNIAEETATLLLADNDPTVLDRILNNDTAKVVVTTERLKEIIGFAGNEVINTVISNISEYENIDTHEIVEAIFELENPGYNFALAEGWKTPKQILRKLAESDDPDIRNAALKSLE